MMKLVAWIILGASSVIIFAGLYYYYCLLVVELGMKYYEYTHGFGR